MPAFDEYSRLRKVALRHARDAFGDEGSLAAQWRPLGYHGKPDLGRAIAEHDRFAELVASGGAEVLWLPADPLLSLDAIYVRDAALVSPGGVILCNMGKPERAPEPAAAGAALAEAGIPIAGAITGEGRIEGGDLVWLDAASCAVGLTYRTNPEGVRQLRGILGDGVAVATVDLPHHRGPSDVFHLMSILSPLDRDLALVHSPLMPIGFRRWLQERGLALLEVPEQELAAMGCNVLALGPRRCLLLSGLPRTRAVLEAAGCEVLVYDGSEISACGAGGPTCLTRPLERG